MQTLIGIVIGLMFGLGVALIIRGLIEVCG
jgi:hypothetical protein